MLYPISSGSFPVPVACVRGRIRWAFERGFRSSICNEPQGETLPQRSRVISASKQGSISGAGKQKFCVIAAKQQRAAL
jgi:hypothetical protein